MNRFQKTTKNKSNLRDACIAWNYGKAYRMQKSSSFTNPVRNGKHRYACQVTGALIYYPVSFLARKKLTSPEQPKSGYSLYKRKHSGYEGEDLITSGNPVSWRVNSTFLGNGIMKNRHISCYLFFSS